MSASAGRGAPADPAVVGRVVRPHALTGEVVVEPMSMSSASFETGSELWLESRWTSIERARPQGDRWIIKLAGVGDRDGAEAIRNAELLVDAATLPVLEEGHYYIHELVGCRVFNPEGDELGEVVAVVPGPKDWLEIEYQGHRSLLPMARDLLHEIDVEAGRIVIDAPQGLTEATRS